MSSQPSDVQEPHALGSFLRALRERLAPEKFGLGGGARRRTPGLRREEAAALSGISPTWYTWMEQGRTTAISGRTLAGIAMGLRLSPAERAYLFQLAGRADPQVPSAGEADAGQFHDLVRAMRSPAYVLGRHWDALAWNGPAAALFPDWLGTRASRSGGGDAPQERNLLRYVFLDPGALAFILDWEERTRRLVAEYRADSASRRGDARHRKLVDELCGASPAFAAAWRSQRVLAREGGVRSFMHPRRGRCDYRQFTLRPAQQPEAKLIVLYPL